MKKVILAICLFLLTLISLFAQGNNSFDDTYLGQKPPGITPEVFAPGIVSIEEGKEYKISFSPDLKEMVFTRRTPRGRNDRIWYCKFENGKITPPELAFFGSNHLELEAAFSHDGKRIYFKSFRPLPGQTEPGNKPSLWFVERLDDGWSEPAVYESELNQYNPVYLSFENDGALYFTNSWPREIRTAEWKDGEYVHITKLPDEINSLPMVAHPAVAPDGSFLIVDSYYEKGDQLVGSLYISFGKPDGSWTKAVSMKKALQASDSDIYAAPRITPDGKYIFFEKYMMETDKSDLYWVDAKVIDNLRVTDVFAK